MPGAFSSRKNLIFDLDGTLVNSDSAHAAAYIEALRPRHPRLADSFDYARFAGQPTAQAFEHMGIPGPELGDLTRRKQELFRASLEKGAVRALPGAEWLLSRLAEEKRRLFLVTGASRISVERILESTKLGRFFERVVTTEDTVIGKPAPDPYLFLMTSHSLAKEACVVIEDGASGIESARAAGLDVIAVHEKVHEAGLAFAQDLTVLASMLL